MLIKKFIGRISLGVLMAAMMVTQAVPLSFAEEAEPEALPQVEAKAEPEAPPVVEETAEPVIPPVVEEKAEPVPQPIVEETAVRLFSSNKNTSINVQGVPKWVKQAWIMVGDQKVELEKSGNGNGVWKTPDNGEEVAEQLGELSFGYGENKIISNVTYELQGNEGQGTQVIRVTQKDYDIEEEVAVEWMDVSIQYTYEEGKEYVTIPGTEKILQYILLKEDEGGEVPTPEQCIQMLEGDRKLLNETKSLEEDVLAKAAPLSQFIEKEILGSNEITYEYSHKTIVERDGRILVNVVYDVPTAVNKQAAAVNYLTRTSDGGVMQLQAPVKGSVDISSYSQEEFAAKLLDRSNDKDVTILLQAGGPEVSLDQYELPVIVAKQPDDTEARYTLVAADRTVTAGDYGFNINLFYVKDKDVEEYFRMPVTVSYYSCAGNGQGQDEISLDAVPLKDSLSRYANVKKEETASEEAIINGILEDLKAGDRKILTKTEESTESDEMLKDLMGEIPGYTLSGHWDVSAQDGKIVVKVHYSQNSTGGTPGGGTVNVPDNDVPAGKIPDPTISQPEEVPPEFIVEENQVPAGPAPEMTVDENQVPGGQLPKTGGIPSEAVIGAGGLLALLGLLIRKRLGKSE